MYSYFIIQVELILLKATRITYLSNFRTQRVQTFITKSIVSKYDPIGVEQYATINTITISAMTINCPTESIKSL